MDSVVEFLKKMHLPIPHEIQIGTEIYQWSTGPIGKLIGKLIVMLFMQMVTALGGKVAEKAKSVANKIEKLAQLIEKIIKLIKKLIEIIKKIIEAASKVIQPIIQLYFTFPSPSCWVAWGITIVVAVLVFFAILFGRYGGFQGEFMIDFDKMKELNQNEEEYTDLLNQDALREAFYQSVSDTSFYQTFNLKDMDGADISLANMIVASLASQLSGTEYTSEDILAQQKCTTSSAPSCVYSGGNLLQLFTYAGISVPQLDNRYNITDANKNPAKYLIQAEALGTYSDGYGLTSYFRDYWNREESFQLDADFLYELNRWIYETDNYPTTEQIVYPEAFVKPVSFVNDFLRIQNDNTLDAFGDPYVYVTERVTLDDIKEPTNKYYGKYEYEGLIKSLPSDIVYDYVIAGTNSYEILNSTNSANQVNIGNASQYATTQYKVEYADGTYEYTDVIMKFYWIVNPAFMDKHMGVDITFKNFTSYVDKSASTYTNYYYKDKNGNNVQIGGSTSAFIGPFLNPREEVVNGKTTIVFDYMMNEYASGAGAIRNDTTTQNREYVYQQFNPNIKNSAFMVLEDGSIKFVNCVVDLNASQDKGQTIYQGEGVYSDGYYYYYAGHSVAADSMDPESNTLTYKAKYFVKVPRVVDYETNAGKTVYPGEIILVDKWVTPSSFVIANSTSNFKFLNLTSGSKTVQDSSKYVELTAADLYAGRGLSKGYTYHFSAVYEYTGTEAKTLNSSFIASGLANGVFKDDELKQIKTMDDNNFMPRKHYQLAQLTDDDGRIVSSSRNLINKTYLKKKTVRPYYRNSDEYWAKFEEFCAMDKDRAAYIGVITNAMGVTFAGQCVILGDEDTGFYSLHYCETTEKDSCQPDSEEWEEKKCSVIKYINQLYPMQDLVAKLSSLFLGDQAQFAEIETSAEAIYHILVLYEDWLIANGTEGVEWEYKYYSNTLTEANEAAREFMPSWSFFGLSIPDPYGISTYFESDKRKYKDTFDTVVELNESRAVSSEYTPIAVVSGTQLVYQQVVCSKNSCGKTYTTAAETSICPYCGRSNTNKFYNNASSSWGWKLNADGTIKKVYGEVSLEFPDYYSDFDVAADVMTQMYDDMLDFMAEFHPYLQVVNGGRKVSMAIANFMFNTDYAQNIYGEVNFAYKWVKESGSYTLKYDADALTDFYTCLFLDAANLPKLDGGDNETVNDTFQDVRNNDQAWNADVEVWRPAESSNNSNNGVMVSCKTDKRGCGRVTSKVEPDDYLAMELKSVRDYGLGSVLSYLEGRKVTFFSGIAISETYDIDGVYAWVYSYYNTYGTFPPCNKHEEGRQWTSSCSDCQKSKVKFLEKQAKLATSGFYPSSLLDESIKITLVRCPFCAGELNGRTCKDCKKYVDTEKYSLTYFVKSTYLYEESGTKDGDDSNDRRKDLLDIGEEFLPSDLSAIADGLNALQGTGSSIFEYKNPNNGETYWFTVTYAVGVNDVNTNTNDLLKKSQGFILMMKKDPTNPDSKWYKTTVNIAIPYLTEEGIGSLFASANFVANNMVDELIQNNTCPQCAAKLNWLKICPNCGVKLLNEYSDIMARAEANNQFFNPKGYYLAWYDYATGNLDLGDHLSSLITREELVAKYDNNTAATLRQIFNNQAACGDCQCGDLQGHVVPSSCIAIDDDNDNICDTCKQKLCPCLCHDGMITLEEVSDIKTKFWASNHFLNWIADLFDIGNLFDGAGKYTDESVYNYLYDTYYNDVFAIDLIDQSKTSNVYMIEEAVTFLGNFVYTYDTQLLIAGDIYGSEKIVSDLVFADRGYIISNYTFAVPVYTTYVAWNNESYEEGTIKKYDHSYDQADINAIYADNPCFVAQSESDTNSWIVNAAKNTWAGIKTGATFVLDDVLKIVSEDDINQSTVLKDGTDGEQGKPLTYCASNYYYQEVKKFKYESTYIYKYSENTTSGHKSCNSSNTHLNGTSAGTKVTCNSYTVVEKYVDVKDENGNVIRQDPVYGTRYYKTTTVWKQGKTSGDNKDYSSIKNYNNQWVGSRYYLKTTIEKDIDHSELKYTWALKWGYTYKLNTVNYDNSIYIDTYNEVTQVYHQLKTNNYKNGTSAATAKKIFIGLQILADVDEFAWFGIDENKVDLHATHFYTAQDWKECPHCGYHNTVNANKCKGCDARLKYPTCFACGYENNATAKKCANCKTKLQDVAISTGAVDDQKNTLKENASPWCIRDDAGTKCLKASFGDEDWHYAKYDVGLLTEQAEYAVEVIENGIPTIGKIFSSKIDIIGNLHGRYGVLLGENRIKNGVIQDVQWWLNSNTVKYYNGNGSLPMYDVIADSLGNLDDFNITKSTDFVEINEYTFELTQQDLTNIADAIYDVYGSAYRVDKWIELTSDINTLKENAGDGQSVTLSMKLLDDKDTWTWNRTVRGSEASRELSGKKIGGAKIDGSAHSKSITVNFVWKVNEENAKNEGSTSYYEYYRTVRKQHRLSNDWKLLMVGLEVGNKGQYGTPIALETTLYGSIKQIAPVETGMFFNEEVYSSWIDRMKPTQDSTAKDDYLLNYRIATSNYLYDYVMNFETYIPLGVKSDSDLVVRGADAYTSIQANDNRTLKYTAAYSTQIKKYLEMPGWQSIIENYNHKTPMLEGLISAIVPSVTSNDMNVDVMTQYIAGLIETSVEYAPTWMVEYYNAAIETENNKRATENEKNKTNPSYIPKKMLPLIERSYDNYALIEDQMYETLFATNSSDLSTRTVKLLMEDGSTCDYELLYVGYGALLAVDNQQNITTTTIGKKMVNGVEINTISGFDDVTLTINGSKDERLDMEKAIKYVCTKFGKLLYKYGNVSSATMAYFYGETYWDEMLNVAASQGISTGPEWHNDDEELIATTLLKLSEAVHENDELPLTIWDEDQVTTVFTAKVVDYNLSFVTDPAKRIFLIRNTSSSLGSSISTISSLAEETRNFYEQLTSEQIEIYMGHKWAEDVIYRIDYRDINEIARKTNVDVGVLMAIMMAESGGDPCYGLGTCRVVDGNYVMTMLYENKYPGFRAGLFGLPYVGTLELNKTRVEVDYKESCDEGNFNATKTYIKSTYDSATKKCTTQAYSAVETYSSSKISEYGWGWFYAAMNSNFVMWNVEMMAQDIATGGTAYEYTFDKLIEAIENYTNLDGRFTNEGKNALVYAALKLNKLYEKNADDALAAIFEYFYGADQLAKTKEAAQKKGFGSNWYAYFCDVTPDYNNKVKRTLEYYDPTLEDENVLTIEESGSEYTPGNYEGKTVVSTYYDREYQKTVQLTKSYSGCVRTNTGTCIKTNRETNKKEQQLKSYCTTDYAKNNWISSTYKDVVVESATPSNSNTYANVSYKFVHEWEMSENDCTAIYNSYKTKLTNAGLASNIKNFCETADKYSVTNFDLVADMTGNLDEWDDWWWNWLPWANYGDNRYELQASCYIYHKPEYANITPDIIKALTEGNSEGALWWKDEIITQEQYNYWSNLVSALESSGVWDSSSLKCKVKGSNTASGGSGASKPSSIYITKYVMNKNAKDSQLMFTSSGSYTVSGDYVVEQSKSTTVYITKAVAEFTTSNEHLSGENGNPLITKYNNSTTGSGTITSKETYADCTYTFTHKTSDPINDKEISTKCAVGGNVIHTEFVYDDQEYNPADPQGMYKCKVDLVKKIDYANRWDISINGFSVSAFSLFGDTSNYNEYMKDKLGMQNNGIEVYEKTSGGTRTDVDVIITATFATEDNFMLSPTDYSLFAFFTHFDNYTDTTARSWWTPTYSNGTPSVSIKNDGEGKGTDNNYTKNELWDFPVIKQFTNSPTGSKTITIVEQFGEEQDKVNGGYKDNNGLSLYVERGDSIYSMISGTVTASGYHPLYGNYVEIQDTNCNILVSTVEGVRYQVTGIRMIYGYLLDERSGGWQPSVGTYVSAGTRIGYAGLSGRTSGNQVYIAMYLDCNQLDEHDDVVKTTGWLPVDLEPYFTTQFTSGNYTVKYKD